VPLTPRAVCDEQPPTLLEKRRRRGGGGHQLAQDQGQHADAGHLESSHDRARSI